MILFIIIILLSIWVIAMWYLKAEKKYKEREKRNRDYLLGEFKKIMKGDKK